MYITIYFNNFCRYTFSLIIFLCVCVYVYECMCDLAEYVKRCYFCIDTFPLRKVDYKALCSYIFYCLYSLSGKALLTCGYTLLGYTGFRFSLGQNVSNIEPNQIDRNVQSLTVLNFEDWLYYVKLFKINFSEVLQF